MKTTSALLFVVWCTAAAAIAQGPPVHDLGLLPGDSLIASSVNSQQNHAVARGGDQCLVVWADNRGQSAGGGTNQSGSDIFGVRLDADGNPVDAVPFAIYAAAGEQRHPIVAWNGQDWLVVFESQDPVGGYYETQMRAVRVSPLGRVLDPLPISFPATQFTPNTIGLNVCGQNGQWLITRCIYHSDGYGTFLAGQRLDSGGHLIDTNPLLLNDWVYGATATVTANGEYLVAGPDWNNSSVIKARRIGQDGRPIGTGFTIPSLNIASSGTEYYVSWIADYVNLVGSRMTATGTLLTPAGTILAAGQAQYSQSTLAHDGVQWWFEWGASDQLRTVRIASSGAVLDAGGGRLMPIVIGGNINTAYSPVLSPRPGGGVHLVWYDLRAALGYDANVYVLPIDPGNAPGGERCVSTGTRNQRVPDLSRGPGNSAAAVFVSEAANDGRVLLHLLDADGAATTAEPIEVARGPSVGGVGIAWNGSVYMVVWDEGGSGGAPTSIKARRLNPDGTAIDSAPIPVMAGFDPDVEALGDDFLVASSRVAAYPQTIFAQARRIDGATGAMLDVSEFTLGGGYVSTGPRVRSDGARWVVVYHSHWSHDSSQSDAVYNFVNADGTFSPARNPATSSGGAGTPDVAFSGNSYLFVWRNNSLSNANNFIAGRVMNRDGTFATGTFTIAEATGRQLRPVVEWDGSTFVVGWDDQRNQVTFFDERTDIYGARVSDAGVVLDPAGFPIDRGSQGDATAAIVSTRPGVTLVASARFSITPPWDSYRVGVVLVGDRPCFADFDLNGGVDGADVEAFFTDWEAGEARADVNQDGGIDGGDVGTFFMAWEHGGC